MKTLPLLVILIYDMSKSNHYSLRNTRFKLFFLTNQIMPRGVFFMKSNVQTTIIFCYFWPVISREDAPLLNLRFKPYFDYLAIVVFTQGVFKCQVDGY